MHRKVRNVKRAKQAGRQARVARRISRSGRPRLTVYRTAKHIYAQLVDPVTGKTVASASTRSSVVGNEGGTGNVGAAVRVGKAIAQLAKQHQIEEVVFNRNGFLYHGRVKALADAARENGLKF